jgi:DNA-binding PadR family transcriptional regulator
VDNPGRPLTDEVLAYMARHPQAQDTVEGIAEWWLLEQHIHHAVSDVEAALSELVDNGFLVARQCRDGRTYYRLNRDREQEIRRHLRQVETTQETKPDPRDPSA